MSKSRNNDTLIVAHARRELELAGAFKKTKDYDGILGRAILAQVKTFCEWTKEDPALMEVVHQGFSAVIMGELLSPPTDDPEEWEKIEREDNKRVWRNRRSPFYISTDKGKSWINMTNEERGKSRNHITGEDPEDENERPGEEEPAEKAADSKPTEKHKAKDVDTSDTPHDKDAGGTGTTGKRSDEAPEKAKKPSVKSGVAEKSKKDTKPKKKTTEKSEERKKEKVVCGSDTVKNGVCTVCGTKPKAPDRKHYSAKQWAQMKRKGVLPEGVE